MVQGKRTVSDEEIINEMKTGTDPAFTTSELAEKFGMTTEGIRGRLKQLESQNQIQSKKPSSRTVLWWVDKGHSSAVCST